MFVDPEDCALTPNKVGQLYRNWIIPLTKKVEVEVLINRFIENNNYSKL